MDISLIDNQIESKTFVVKEGEELNLNLASFSKFSNTEIIVNVEENARFNGAFVDFSDSSFTLNLTVNLLGRNSSCEWHSACLSKADNRKVFDTSLYHKEKESSGTMSNYGICTENSKLTFTGISKIEKGCKKSKTHQEAKIIVFDPSCNGKCSPILKIDENDVEASHAAVVGRVNEDHLFYLLSRGIKKEDAKRLITLGYLLPIKQYFTDETIINKIDETIEKGFIC